MTSSFFVQFDNLAM